MGSSKQQLALCSGARGPSRCRPLLAFSLLGALWSSYISLWGESSVWPALYAPHKQCITLLGHLSNDSLTSHEANLWFNEGAESGFDAGLLIFADFLKRKRSQLDDKWDAALQGLQERGIVIAAGFPSSLANTFVNLYVLRHSLGCKLPVAIMYWGDNPADNPSKSTVVFMQRHISNLQFIDASKLPYPMYHRMLQRDTFNGWKIKSFAIYAAPFVHALFMDSDNMLLLDPTFLFDSPEYQQHGSLFWPDIWCGDPPIFARVGLNVGNNIPQTESGQFLVNRDRHRVALEWALWLNSRDEVTFKHAYGDKDTFRAAFHLAGAHNHYFQVLKPLSLLLTERSEGGFNIAGFLQVASNGSALFAHRVSGTKYDPNMDDGRPVTHVAVCSCHYFKKRGWTIDGKLIVPADYALKEVITVEKCNFNPHELQSAAQRCAGYNAATASGTKQLPIFKIPEGSYFDAALAASEKAFKKLRKSKKQDSSRFLL